MGSSQKFDYNQATRETLAGIYVEATDGTPNEVARADKITMHQQSVAQVQPRLEELFGFILTVDDRI